MSRSATDFAITSWNAPPVLHLSLATLRMQIDLKDGLQCVTDSFDVSGFHSLARDDRIVNRANVPGGQATDELRIGRFQFVIRVTHYASAGDETVIG